jgi:hypothetical protein
MVKFRFEAEDLKSILEDIVSLNKEYDVGGAHFVINPYKIAIYPLTEAYVDPYRMYIENESELEEWNDDIKIFIELGAIEELLEKLSNVKSEYIDAEVKDEEVYYEIVLRDNDKVLIDYCDW